MLRALIISLGVVASIVSSEPRIRPANWAIPVINSCVDNWHMVDHHVYRSAQPDDKGMKQIEQFGIQNILNLRDYHSDEDDAYHTGLILYRVKMSASDITDQEIEKALAIITHVDKPILVHCWHGSDRTGVVIAMYRIIVQGWTRQQAIDELVNGGYGYHSIYQGIITYLQSCDTEKIKQGIITYRKTLEKKVPDASKEIMP